MIKRELYLKKIRDLYDSELIKVIMGIRRCGKSVLLGQIIEEIKERGIKEDHIIYINFEDYDFIEYTEVRKFNEKAASLSEVPCLLHVLRSYILHALQHT